MGAERFGLAKIASVLCGRKTLPTFCLTLLFRIIITIFWYMERRKKEVSNHQIETVKIED
ncbi:MAG: hypothetical protein CVU57_30470 [Deltaproteobacteria bacterium HGW-Deltaproteobacteria-15]|nr:MAG: hypothetical protein CVU57_30470 [Deltaproteobacteria bacterium HGW-Deltaproteobacteria-15]